MNELRYNMERKIRNTSIETNIYSVRVPLAVDIGLQKRYHFIWVTEPIFDEFSSHCITLIRLLTVVGIHIFIY